MNRWFIAKSQLKKETIVTAKTIQVFMNTDRELLLTLPEFVIEWKKKWKLL